MAELQGAASASEAIIWTVSDIGRDCGGRDALTSEIPFSCVSFLSLESYHVLQYIVICTHGRRGGGRRAAEEVVGLELSSRPAKSGHGGSSAADLRRVRSYHVSFEVWTGPMAHGIISLSRSPLETFLRRPLRVRLVPQKKGLEEDASNLSQKAPVGLVLDLILLLKNIRIQDHIFIA